jgi:hypothetical protein
LVETDNWIAEGVSDKHRLNRRATTPEQVIVIAGQIGPLSHGVRAGIGGHAGVSPDPESRVWIQSYRR